MTRRNRIVLICLNVLLIALGLYFGIPSYRSSIPTSRRSAEETKALVEKESNLEKLRAIVLADDDSIRADRELTSLFRDASIAVSAAAAAVGVAGLIVLSFSRKPEASA
jgi:hypothetical protein